MTDPRGVHSAHLDAETIAAFVDRTLDPAARAAAEAHLATCADCREVWVETSEIAGDEDVSGWGATAAAATDTPPTHARSSRRWWPLLTAAAVILASGWYAMTPSATARALRELQPSSASHRFSEGRLSAQYSYLPAPPRLRGGEAELPASVRRQALWLQEQAETDPSTSRLRAAAVAYLAVGEPHRAIGLLESASKIEPRNADVRNDLAVAWLEQSRRTGHAIDAARALDEAKRAIVLSPSSLEAQFNLALAFEAIGLTAQARDAYETYLSLDVSSPWAEEARRRMHALQSVEPQLSSGTELYRRIEDRLLPAWSEAVLGEHEPDLRDLVNAASRLASPGDRGIGSLVEFAIRADTGRSARICAAQAFLALSTWNQAFEDGRSEVAAREAERATSGLRCAGLPVFESESRRATSLLELSRLKQADTLAGALLVESGTQGFHRAHARMLQVRALAAQASGRFSDAVDLSSRAVDAARRGADAEFGAGLETHLASLFSKQGDITNAWTHLSLAMKGEEESGSTRRRYSILGRGIVSAMELHLHGAALAISEALAERTRGWSNPVGLAFARVKQAQALAELDQRTLANAALLESRSLLASIPSAAVRESLEAELDVADATLTANAQSLASINRAVAYFDRTGNRLMLAPALLTRGRLFARSAQPAAAEADWKRGAAIVEDQRPEIRDAQLRISRLDRVWELFEELISSAAQHDAVQALEIAERGRARQLLDSLARHQTIQPLAGSELYRWLPAGADALVFAALPDRLLIWHLTAGSVHMTTRAITPAALDSQVSAFRAALEHGKPADSRQLEQLLFPAEFAPRSTLLIVADGPLHRLPFGALRVSTGRFLAEAATLVTGPSLTASAFASAQQAQARPDALFVGAGRSVPSEGLPALAAVSREIGSLLALYPGSTALVDEQASSGTVLAALPDHTLLHFSGHAVADALYPARSRLVLGPSDALTSAQIAASHLRPGTIVVLGACDTANGEVFKGEGSLALSRAFFAAGAASVVAALWKVDDAEAERFLVDFHRALTQSPSAARALFETQRAWIASGAKPGTWAAFQVMGATPASRSL